MRVAFLAIGLLSAAPASAASTAHWRESLKQLVADIRATHPDPYGKIGKLTFDREAERLLADLPRLGEEQRVVRAMRLVASLGDGHTQLEPTGAEWRRWYPIRIVEFADGYFITGAHKSAADVAGAQVLEIGGRPVAVAAEAARDLMGTENGFDRRLRLYALHNEPLMRGLGLAGADGSLRLKAKLRSGRTVERTLRAARQTLERYANSDSFLEWAFPSEVYGLGIGSDDDWIAAFRNLPSSAFRSADPARPPHLTQRTPYFGRGLPEQRAHYVQINQVDDTSFVTFIDDTMREVEATRPDKLIIDLRYNFGGDASRALEAVRSVVRREGAAWRNLYVLTGPKTFSAAVLLLDDLADNVRLTLVGEPAGAPLNHYGDATVRRYPTAGFRATISTLRHQRSDSSDIRSFLPVDVPAPFAFADYIRGADPAVDPILAGEDMRSIPEIVRAEGGARARTVYRQREAQFGKLDWWRAPTEIELRRACDYLATAKRFDDAIEACTLTTEIHPFVWNSWYNLGQTQRAAGRMQDRLPSYRCVVELEPDNWNTPSLKRAIAASTQPVPLPPGCPTQPK